MELARVPFIIQLVVELARVPFINESRRINGDECAGISGDADPGISGEIHYKFRCHSARLSGVCDGFHPCIPHLATIRLLLHPLPFVMEFSALHNGKPNLHETSLEEDRQRDQRQTVILRDLGEFANFATMQQELAFSLSSMIIDRGFGIFGDVAVNQPDLVVVDASIRLFDGDLVIADTFDFAAGQNNAAVQFVQNIVLMPRAAVLADDLSLIAVGGTWFGRTRRSHTFTFL